jgi:hypothetical protein
MNIWRALPLSRRFSKERFSRGGSSGFERAIQPQQRDAFVMDERIRRKSLRQDSGIARAVDLPQAGNLPRNLRIVATACASLIVESRCGPIVLQSENSRVSARFSAERSDRRTTC